MPTQLGGRIQLRLLLMARARARAWGKARAKALGLLLRLPQIPLCALRLNTTNVVSQATWPTHAGQLLLQCR